MWKIKSIDDIDDRKSDNYGNSNRDVALKGPFGPPRIYARTVSLGCNALNYRSLSRLSEALPLRWHGSDRSGALDERQRSNAWILEQYVSYVPQTRVCIWNIARELPSAGAQHRWGTNTSNSFFFPWLSQLYPCSQTNSSNVYYR